MSIDLSGVTRRFRALTAVDGLTTRIETGQFFTVLGPSGCGKSTLLRLIAGLEPLDAGAIALNGRSVAGPGLDLPPEARGLGVVFQSYALWPHLDVLGNVAFPIEATGRGRKAARLEAEAHLRSVALQGLGTRRPADLSGGQRQRVALARCLAGRARVVLMDEPLANLDPHLRAAMEEELSAFHRTSGATTLYITHDQREAMALGDRVAVMNGGGSSRSARRRRFTTALPPPSWRGSSGAARCFPSRCFRSPARERGCASAEWRSRRPGRKALLQGRRTSSCDRATSSPIRRVSHRSCDRRPIGAGNGRSGSRSPICRTRSRWSWFRGAARLRSRRPALRSAGAG